MRSSPLEFPVLALVPDDEITAEKTVEDVKWYLREEDLIRIEKRILKNSPWLKMLLVDAISRNFRIVSVTDLGSWGTSWKKLVWWLFDGRRHVHFELVEQTSLSFEQIRQRVCDSIQTHPHWRVWNPEMDEPGKPRADQRFLDEMSGRVARAATMQELFAALQENDDILGDPEALHERWERDYQLPHCGSAGVGQTQ